MKDFYSKFNSLLTLKDKQVFFLLLLMSIFLSFVEAIGITAFMPFISTAATPELIYSNQYYKTVFDFFKLSSTNEFVVYFGFVLIGFYIFRAVFIIFHGYLVVMFSMTKYNSFTKMLYSKYLNMPFSEFVKRNSTTMSKVIVIEALQLSYLLQNIILLLSEIMVVIILYILLLMVDIKMTLFLTLIIGIKILILTKTVSKKIKSIGIERAYFQEKLSKIINESFGNFKIIKFIFNQHSLENKFSNISTRFSNTQILNVTLSTVPRNALESVGLSLMIGVVLYVVLFKDNIADVIPIVTMYALALYRLLPAMTRILNNYNSIIFYLPSLEETYNDLMLQDEDENENDITFRHNVVLNNITFSHDQNRNIINNLTLKITKGDKIAFIGASGSGKSTLVDLICGLYKPNHGEILIDNIKLDNSNIVSWRKKIGYIPQAIYLFDGTIAENITFARDYDEVKLIKVLKQTNVYDFIMEKDGFNTMVGEGGIQLSGGQKQRIGIARALYGDPEILVLDEATSALDTETENIIMDEIYKISENKTLIIIAHRLSTIEKCDIKIDISEVK